MLDDVTHHSDYSVVPLLQEVDEALCVSLFATQKLHRLALSGGWTTAFLFLHFGQEVGIVGVERESWQVSVIQVEVEFSVVLLQDDVGSEYGRRQLALGL